MKKNNDDIGIATLIMFFSILIFIGVSSYFYNNYGWFIPSTLEQELEWCINSKPRFNSSHLEGIQTPRKEMLGKIQQKCFTEYWTEYCKYSYPNYCPT